MQDARIVDDGSLAFSGSCSTSLTDGYSDLHVRRSPPHSNNLGEALLRIVVAFADVAYRLTRVALVASFSIYRALAQQRPSHDAT